MRELHVCVTGGWLCVLCVRCCTGAVCDWRVAVRAVLHLRGAVLQRWQQLLLPQ